MVACSDDDTSGFAIPSTHSQIRLDIFHQNVRGLRTKELQVYESVSLTFYNVTCFTKTWLNDSCQDHNLFPKFYTVFRSDRKRSGKTRRDGDLVAINSKFCDFKRKCYLQFYEECIWVELSTLNGKW
jgi:hypothetical protein